MLIVYLLPSIQHAGSMQQLLSTVDICDMSAHMVVQARGLHAMT